MKYEIYVERKVSTYPYENVTVGYTQQFDDQETPQEAGFLQVRDRLNEWVNEESRRLGPKSPERTIIDHRQQRPSEPYLDLTNEPRDRVRFR